MTGKGIQAKQAVEPQEAISVWEPGSEARQAAQRTHLGRLAGGGWGFAGSQVGPYLSQGAPSSLQHGPGLQDTLGALGLQPGPQGAMSAWPLSQAMQAPGYCVGQGEGEARAEGTSRAGRRLSQRACSPPPFPRTGLASLRYKRGAGTMGVLCPGEALKDPRPTS